MLTKAQKKKREELKKKAGYTFKGIFVIVLLIIGVIYWNNMKDDRSENDSEEVLSLKNESGSLYKETQNNNKNTGKNAIKNFQEQETVGNINEETISESKDKSMINSNSTDPEGGVNRIEKSASEAESGQMTDQGQKAESDSDGKININTAGKEILCHLNGIGEKRAQDIIDYRNLHGAFSNIEEIMKVKGIKKGIFSKIKDFICCG